ncbi:hypothetical protein K438DRAFT_1782007 [Mycena galopus ATCC 62051]|nr:hypothetical protein K438DRAFT_1782007 [Mycena galopus ATCC 62051]
MIAFILFAYLTVASAYIWPSPQFGALESLRFDQNEHSLLGFIAPCTTDNFKPPNSGRSDAADSICMLPPPRLPTFPKIGATHLSFISGFDWSIAVLAGGPEIVFCGGRVDAVEPNYPGATQNPLVVGFNDTTNSDIAQTGEFSAAMVILIPEVITPLPVKPSGIQFVLDRKFSGEVWLWNKAFNIDTVGLIWDDCANGTVITPPYYPPMATSATGGLPRPASFLNFSGRYHIAVRNNVNLTRLYLAQPGTDNVSRPIIIETNIPLPLPPPSLLFAAGV